MATVRMCDGSDTPANAFAILMSTQFASSERDDREIRELGVITCSWWNDFADRDCTRRADPTLFTRFFYTRQTRVVYGSESAAEFYRIYTEIPTLLRQWLTIPAVCLTDLSSRYERISGESRKLEMCHERGGCLLSRVNTRDYPSEWCSTSDCGVFISGGDTRPNRWFRLSPLLAAQLSHHIRCVHLSSATALKVSEAKKKISKMTNIKYHANFIFWMRSKRSTITWLLSNYRH